MDIVLNIEPIAEFFSQPGYIVITRLFYLFGWIPLAIVLLWGFKEMWVFYIQKQWGKTIKMIFLAIDIPRGNEQSPKAVENIFSYLAGAHSTINLIEKYWIGEYQLSFSFEIVGIDGYTQFIIRTPEKLRDLVETAIYSQYPDAEITEVNDYTQGTPTHYPDNEYDIYGVEFIHLKSPAYPIKTYEEFEYSSGDPELAYKDSMATLMDLTSSLKKGEQLWFQIIILPIGFEWPEIGEKEISKIVGEKIKSKKTIIDRLADLIMKSLEFLSELIYPLWGDIEEKEKKEEPMFKMMNLKPGQKKQVEAIQNKISKIGFETKIRFIYVAKKDVMNKGKVAYGMVGFMKQFASLDLNNLKPDMDITATKAAYFLKEKRLRSKKNKIIRNYINRDSKAGRKRGILNIEELATIWHFPVESAVKAPLIQKASRKKAEPPMSLPLGSETVSEELKQPVFMEKDDNFPETINNVSLKKRPEFYDDDNDEKAESLVLNKNEKINHREKIGKPPDNLPII